MSKLDKSGPEQIDVRGNGIRGRLISATMLSAFLVVGIGGWAAQAKLAGAVISQGEIAIAGEIKQVQHIDGGTVVEIPVKAGDFVKRGDVVLKLDETQAKIELGILQTQIQQLGAMRARLVAERDGLRHLSLMANPCRRRSSGKNASYCLKIARCVKTREDSCACSRRS